MADVKLGITVELFFCFFVAVWQQRGKIIYTAKDNVPNTTLQFDALNFYLFSYIFFYLDLTYK